MEYSFFDSLNRQLHSYPVDPAVAQFYPRPLVNIQGQYHIIYCEFCIVNDKLKFKECAIDGCHNKDERDICANHLCCICFKAVFPDGSL